MTQKKTKLKLKKQAYYILAGIVIIVVAVILGVNYYNDFQYRKTYEAKLILLGYSKEEANLLEEKLSSETIDKILGIQKDEHIISFVQQKYFLEKNLESYLFYSEEEENEDYEDVVARINTFSNLGWYQKDLVTDTTQGEKMIVNKFYTLSEEYAPQNLVNIPLTYAYGAEGENKLIDYAYDKFLDLWNAAHDAGYYLIVTSSYRDYQSQKEIYDARKNSQGEKKADETAARPGHSEHQTGLVIDMTSKDAPIGDDFKNSEAYLWLKDHAYQYGFIERYPIDKEYLTGYSPESWHWRYVGVEAATVCHDENITYDEYYAYYIEK